MTTSRALHALLEDVVDYAGLFPPAALPLDQAIHQFAAYRRGPRAWMLGRFVLPVSRFGELQPYASLFTQSPPFRFSVLGSGGDDADRFVDALHRDLKAISSFHAQFKGYVRVDAMEVRFPSSLLDAPAERVRDFVGRLTETIAGRFDLFLEIPVNGSVAEHVAGAIAASITATFATHSIALKFRTGGTEASAFPSSAALAESVVACIRAGVRFKATAGLHHPVRHFSDEVGTDMPGFLNLFGATALAEAHGLDADTVRELLDETDPGQFVITPDAFEWRGLRVSTEHISRTRSGGSISFGSCSFDEPVDDLVTLGLLPT